MRKDVNKSKKDKRKIGKYLNITAVTKVACVKDIVCVIGKVAITILTGSIFMLFNAIYSLVAGSARVISLHAKKKSLFEQYRYCQLIAFLIMLFSAAYTVYMARSFNGLINTQFNSIIGIAVAAFTFFEFGFGIYDLVKLRKTQKPIDEAMKLISFAGILTCFTLTQVVLLSTDTSKNYAVANGISGIFFGSLAFAVGIYLLIKSKKQYVAQLSDSKEY